MVARCLIVRDRVEGAFGLQMHDLKAFGFEKGEKPGHGGRRRGVDVV